MHPFSRLATVSFRESVGLDWIQFSSYSHHSFAPLFAAASRKMNTLFPRPELIQKQSECATGLAYTGLPGARQSASKARASAQSSRRGPHGMGVAEYFVLLGELMEWTGSDHTAQRRVS